MLHREYPELSLLIVLQLQPSRKSWDTNSKLHRTWHLAKKFQCFKFRWKYWGLLAGPAAIWYSFLDLRSNHHRCIITCRLPNDDNSRDESIMAKKVRNNHQTTMRRPQEHRQAEQQQPTGQQSDQTPRQPYDKTGDDGRRREDSRQRG